MGPPSVTGNFASVRNRRIASIKLVLPLPFGPMTRLKGFSATCVLRSALKFRNAMDAITPDHANREHAWQRRIS